MFYRNNKGTIFYTIVGVIVVAIFVLVAIHIMRSTYDSNDADLLRLQRFKNAIYLLENSIEASARYAAYPAIWRAGHNMTPEGVNYYLTIYDGRERLKKDLLRGYTEEINNLLQSHSSTGDGEYYTIESNGIPFKVYRITPENVLIKETPTGMTYYTAMRIYGEDGKYRFDHIVNLSVEVPARMFEMYDRARLFNEKYAERVRWATTIALYARAYYGAYTPGYNGSFLKEGHIAYDPLEQVLRGDLAALKGFSAESVKDLGGIPAATWLTEWEILGEPSYLPAGVDYDIGKEINEKITDLIRDTYDLDKAAGCDTLTGTDKINCEEFNNPEKIREKAANIAAERKRMEAIAQEIIDWKPSKEETCDEFRAEAERIISDVVGGFSMENAQKTVINPGMDYVSKTELEPYLSNNEEVAKITASVNTLTHIKENRLPLIGNLFCNLPSDMDCSCGKGPYNCYDPTDCLTCNNPSCNKIICSSGGPDYSCSPEDWGYYRRESVNCKHKTCDEKCDENGCYISECETEELTRTVRIEQCNCQCHPLPDLIKDTKEELGVIKTIIEKRAAGLKYQENELNNRADTIEEARKKLNEISSLTSSISSTGYDVLSWINYNNIKYYDAATSAKCYFNPNWTIRRNGTCGDKASSVGLYTGQISAAIACCILTSFCCPFIEYTPHWFPAIYRVEGSYNISETIVDEKNRIMLHNLFTGEQDLYGYNITPKLFNHVAPEVEIYRNYKVEVKPKTGDMVLVYIYLLKIPQTKTEKGGALNKILDSFNDPSCTGKAC